MIVKQPKLNWKWPEGMKPSGRPLTEVLEEMRADFYRTNGRFLTEEECIELVEEIRREIAAKSR